MPFAEAFESLWHTIVLAGAATFITQVIAVVMAVWLFGLRNDYLFKCLSGLALLLEALGPLLPTAVLLALLPRLPITVALLWLALLRWPFLSLPLVSTAHQGFGETYVSAARSLGASTWYILWRHLRHDILRVLVSTSLSSFSGTILIFASIDFLGIGSFGQKTIGAYLAQNFQLIRQSPAPFVLGLGCLLIITSFISWFSIAVQRAVATRGGVTL